MCDLIWLQDQGNINFKHSNLGKAKVTVNPNWNRSSLDGTQSDNENYTVCKASVISTDGFSFRPKDNGHSCYVNFTVTCYLRSSLTNGISNGDAEEHGISSVLSAVSLYQNN